MAEGQGDAAIAAHVATDEQQRIDTMYHYIPDWGGPQWWSDWAGEGMRTPSAVTYYTVGTLILDIFDTKSRKENGFTSIWHGTAAGTVSNDLQENQRKIKESVQEIFKNFPTSGANSSPSR